MGLLCFSFFTFLYLSFPLFFFHLPSSSFESGRPLCHDNERYALLGFKKSLLIRKSASGDPSGYPKTELWNNISEKNGDYCSWDGVKCNEDTGFVIELDLSSSCLYGSINSTSNLFDLVHLQWLNLSDNHFNDSEIPFGIKNLSKLSHLNLSSSGFYGQIPSKIFELSKLESLDLSYKDNTLSQTLQQLPIEKLTNLKVLHLKSCSLEGAIPSSLGNLTNLIRLDLSRNNFQGIIPSSLGNLTNLIHLDFSVNNFQGIIPASLGNLTNLIDLDISSNNFQGIFPSTSIGNLASLEFLDIGYCNLSVKDPSSLSNLTKLNHLDLSYNNFLSPTSTLSWIGKHTKLTNVYLSGINFGSEIPLWLMNLTHLTELSMNENQLTGTIPLWLMNLKQLSALYLRSNHLTGPIPYQISNLTQLNLLYLSSNQLQGTIPSSVFELNNLEGLYLSSNNLSLSSCNPMGFPNFLRSQDQLRYLDLSSNNLSGQIPGWLFNLSLIYLNVSHNLLTGFDQIHIVLPWTTLDVLDLRFNKLEGPLPIPPMSTFHYLVSNNKLSGEIPMQICKLDNLYALDLSNNNFTGKLPKCLGNFSYGLSILDLQNNSFSGSIPHNFISGTNLRMIDLSNNLLRGKIPRSLVNCTNLEYLDLGNNKINDTFPSWLGKLPKLEVLNLQWNKLHDVIEEPMSDFEFPKLRMIDLSHNKFIGKFPAKYFQCWNAMKVVDESGLTYMLKEKNSSDAVYDYSLTVVNKGIEIEYVKIPNMLTGIWLSSNSFEGEIPASISILKGLRYLDLSDNNLVGEIPSSLDNLTVLESLVLSNNKLSGEIPQQLVKLMYLAFFNVSYNHLKGSIPQGAQFNTFDNRSYEGNPGLCGQPLSKKCGNSEFPPEEDDEGSESPFAFDWKIVAIGFASGLIIGVVLGHIFCAKKHEWFVKIFGMPLKRD